MRKKCILIFLTAVMAISLCACGNPSSSSSSKEGDNSGDSAKSKTEVQVFIAASLNQVMNQVAKEYQKTHPDVKIIFNADSSGTLLTQIENGYSCDIFFSAAKKQMDQLEKDGLIEAGSRSDVGNNQLVVVTRKDSGTKVTGLHDLGEATSIAMADGSVPAGQYTRKALMNIGILPQSDHPDKVTTQEVSKALGGVEISEQSNVSKVLMAVQEGSSQVGTTYYSDTYGYQNDLKILEKVPYEETGDVIYPIALVKNEEADTEEKNAANDFLTFVKSDSAKAIFSQYLFDTNVKR